MKIPLTPPKMNTQEEITKYFSDSIRHLGRATHPINDKGEYLHWDELRHHPLPENYSSMEYWWFAIKQARKACYSDLPFKDKLKKPFVLGTPMNILSSLHKIDCSAGNNTIINSIPLLNNEIKDMYLIKSLMEEAINSSQLEGASTTREVAEDMLRNNRKPKDKNEQMISNNYLAMKYIREIKNESLSEDIILRLHYILTANTLDNPQKAGSLRTISDPPIHVCDEQGYTLFIPPDAMELPARLKLLCKFANQEEKNLFIHPIVKGILLHFMLAYDHPFADGNGRTARALFYWFMAKQNYGLMEFISISEIIKNAHVQYFRAFLYTETDENDTTYFVIHQLNVLLKAIDSLHKYIDKKSKELHAVEKLLFTSQNLKHELNLRQISLIQHALKHPGKFYKIDSYREIHNITYQTARVDLLGLANLNLLIKQKTGKFFIFISPPDLKQRIEEFAQKENQDIK